MSIEQGYFLSTNAINRKRHAIGVFLDLSKAFDTIDHNILLSKMSKYGIRGTANSWFANYLTNRKQYTCLNGKFSAPLTLKCGVPQGSILGPLLFIIYVNDISNVSNKCSLVLFADDTNIFFTDNNASNLERLVCEELQKFNSWFAANKLSLNVGKTKYMVFNDKNPNFNISMDGGCISRVDSIKKFRSIY